jgi:hypothetical protein
MIDILDEVYSFKKEVFCNDAIDGLKRKVRIKKPRLLNDVFVNEMLVLNMISQQSF